jgi:protein-S-isoprenylcysteine O-methyltransferase Ste14
MYVAVLTIVAGQSLFHGSAPVAGYGVLVWFAFHLFVVLYEEPSLGAAYGSEYERYCACVPRWIPRRTAWPA